VPGEELVEGVARLGQVRRHASGAQVREHGRVALLAVGADALERLELLHRLAVRVLHDVVVVVVDEQLGVGARLVAVDRRPEPLTLRSVDRSNRRAPRGTHQMPVPGVAPWARAV